MTTFLAFVIDFLLCSWKPEINDKADNALVMDVFPIAGGSVGMLLALFVLTGLERGHRMNKNNVAWWFLAIVCLIVWGFITATNLGFVTLGAEIEGVCSGWDFGRLKIIGIYLAVINIVTFFAFVWDKHVAANGNDYRRRAPEARLLGLGLVGGSLGGLLATSIVRHKTKKWCFVWGLPCFMVLNIAAILYAHMTGLV